MLSKDQITSVLGLLRSQPVAALGTLHAGEPFVSMVPFAVLPRAGALVVHVSALASHTKDMLNSPVVSLMVMGAAGPDSLPQSLPRATFQCQAKHCEEADPRYSDARSTYLDRFPQSQELFNFSDFSLFMLEPRHMRFVGGFAQATSVMQPELASVLSMYAASAA